MPEPLSQNQRQGKLTTPLGETALALFRFSAIEGLERIVRIPHRGGQHAGRARFRFGARLGSTIELLTQDGKKRYFQAS